MAALKCTACDEDINPQLDYRQVIGWEKRRGTGGTNAIRLRKPQEIWMCSRCVDKEARKLNALQGSLI